MNTETNTQQSTELQPEEFVSSEIHKGRYHKETNPEGSLFNITKLPKEEEELLKRTPLEFDEFVADLSEYITEGMTLETAINFASKRGYVKTSSEEYLPLPNLKATFPEIRKTVIDAVKLDAGKEKAVQKVTTEGRDTTRRFISFIQTISWTDKATGKRLQGDCPIDVSINFKLWKNRAENVKEVK